MPTTQEDMISETEHCGEQNRNAEQTVQIAARPLNRAHVVPGTGALVPLLILLAYVNSTVMSEPSVSTKGINKTITPSQACNVHCDYL